MLGGGGGKGGKVVELVLMRRYLMQRVLDKRSTILGRRVGVAAGSLGKQIYVTTLSQVHANYMHSTVRAWNT